MSKKEPIREIDRDKFVKAGDIATSRLSLFENVALNVGSGLVELTFAVGRIAIQGEELPSKWEDWIVGFYSFMIPGYAYSRHKWAEIQEGERVKFFKARK